MLTRKDTLQYGDWVKAVTNNDELIFGYVDHVNSLNETVTLVVVSSDNKTSIGRKIALIQQKVTKLEDAGLDYEAGLLNMIDLALESNDKEWFMELTTSLYELQQRDQTSSGLLLLESKPNNTQSNNS
ncbi:IDEAL domain-containing protein [Sinobaca qinghaiensis]|uniref:IDEAL domain-containing protein n=1 Tax=Sinobaca qinghaiensis TaxID=342944 RepID=A0A419V5J7_9BACL|nr:IDEAL domain-containing protein [Sinobaca qinghaiensis]RKD75262.1 IDEAL domain-containing protein [Sinobaca qinghaiensis]